MESKPLLSIVVTIDFKDNIEEFIRPFMDPDIDRPGYQITIVEETGWKFFPKKTYEKIYTPRGSTIEIIREKKCCRARQRNIGISRSHADIILLFAGDFVPAKDTLPAHLQFHSRYPQNNYAAMGPAVFIKEKKTPFMSWLEDTGTLFGTPFLDYKEEQEVNFFYGGNVSLKREFLLSVGPFDEYFPYDACEDYDMGKRLFKAGMKIILVPEATVIHEHDVTVDQRMTLLGYAGKSTVLLDQKYPDDLPWIADRTVSIKEIEGHAKGCMREYKNTGDTKWLYQYYHHISRAAFCKSYQKELRRQKIIN